MTAPDADAQRLRWVEKQAGVYDEDDHDDEQETPDWTKTSS